ncbi:MAG: amidohydrolase family protein [Deltaproteobacteria bacterium]|nr:amidohydrolase family protein [Deltaproteobacteria bacterium]
MTFDVVIRGGRVVDGSGLGAYRADVAITGDRIAAIGRIVERGRREIDAEGHVVTPGFIDGHTHFDAQLFWDPQGANSCWHGVTTAVMGNCGFTLAPAHANARALVVRNLERAEDLDPAALAAGIPWSWETFPEFMDAVDRTQKAIHYAANIGHSALRTFAMGERAFTEQASEADLARMEAVLEDALRAGAIGFTTTRSEHHETSDDRPVASRLASWEELHRLAGVMARLGTGILEGGTEGVLSSDPAVVLETWRHIRRIAVEQGVPVTAGLIATKAGGRAMLEQIDAIAKAGGRMYGQSHCRGISVLLSFKTRLPFDVLPSWKALRSLTVEEQRLRLSDPAERERFAELAMEGDYSGWRGLGAMPRPPDYDGIRVYARGLPPNPTVREVAKARGVSPARAMIDLAVESDFETLFIQPSLYPQDEEVLLDVLRHPRTIMTFSDSGAHLSQIADASIHTYLLGYWVRERGQIGLEEAVRMLSFEPALAWGFSDRGLVREGLQADLNVFDPATVAPAVPRVVDDLPAGRPRLSQKSTGFRATLVAGRVTVENGEPTGAYPGRLFRNRLAAGRPGPRTA